MGQFGSKGGLRRIAPLKSDQSRPSAAALKPQPRPKAASHSGPATKSA